MKSHYVWSLIGLMTIASAVWAEDDGNTKPKRTPAESFAKMDTDGNGELTSAEYSRRKMRRAKKKGASEEEIAKLQKKMDKRFSKVDTDSSGSVSLEEYVANGEKMAERKAKKAAKNQADDGDGGDED